MIIPAVQRPQMPANNNIKRFANSKEHCSRERKRKRSQRLNSAFDARGDRLCVYNLLCAGKTQLEVCANPAQDLLQCWVVREPVSLISSAEFIDDSGVGNCSKILILCCQHGFKENQTEKQQWWCGRGLSRMFKEIRG